MIDKTVFKAGLDDLADSLSWARFPQRKVKVWYEFLNEHLSQDEFQKAIDLALVHLKECPTAQELVDLVKGSGRELAAEAWASTQEYYAGRKKLHELDAATQYSIKKLAIPPDFSIHDVWKLRFDFVTIWEGYRRRPDSDFVVAGVPSKNNNVAEQQEPEYVPCPPEIKDKIRQQISALAQKTSW